MLCPSAGVGFLSWPNNHSWCVKDGLSKKRTKPDAIATNILDTKTPFRFRRRSSLSYLLLRVQLVDKPAVVDLSEIVHVPERHRVGALDFRVLALGELEDIADRGQGRIRLLLQDRRELLVHVPDDLVEHM